MKVIDVIFSLISGRIIALVLSDILRGMDISVTVYERLVIWLAFPFLALFCLWISSIIGRKMLIVFQGAKHVLVGGVATVADLKIFELLVWIFIPSIALGTTLIKGISFILSTALKYWGNKYWVFRKHEKENIKKELIQFFTITVFGLLIDIVSFHYLSHVFGPQFGVQPMLWTKMSVIAAALIAAIWNFAGYKFFVFKR